MFGIGSLEFVIIIAIVLIFLSPKDLISIIKSFKQMKGQLQAGIKKSNTYVEKIIEDIDIKELKKQNENILNNRKEDFYQDITSITNKKFKDATNLESLENDIKK